MVVKFIIGCTPECVKAEMGKAITVTGLSPVKLKGVDKCTPIEKWSETLNRWVTVCKEYSRPAEAGPNDVFKRRKGRPKGTSKKDCGNDEACKRRRSPELKACSREERGWMKVRKGYRCRCVAKGKSRFLKNSECSHLDKP